MNVDQESQSAPWHSSVECESSIGRGRRKHRMRSPLGKPSELVCSSQGGASTKVGNVSDLRRIKLQQQGVEIFVQSSMELD